MFTKARHINAKEKYRGMSVSVKLAREPKQC